MQKTALCLVQHPGTNLTWPPAEPKGHAADVKSCLPEVRSRLQAWGPACPAAGLLLLGVQRGLLWLCQVPLTLRAGALWCGDGPGLPYEMGNLINV